MVSKKSKKVLSIIIVTIIAFMLAYFMYYITLRSEMQISEAGFDPIYVTDKVIKIGAVMQSSGESYANYSYKIEDNSLYLTIYKNNLLFMATKHGTCRIDIELKDDFTKIKKIYLKCYKRNDLLWEGQ